MEEKTRIFVAQHCAPCEIIKSMIEQNRLSEAVEVIDIESDAGFPLIAEYQLEGVPCAYKGKQRCDIQIDTDENIMRIVCPITKSETKVDLPSSSEGPVPPPSSS